MELAMAIQDSESRGGALASRSGAIELAVIPAVGVSDYYVCDSAAAIDADDAEETADDADNRGADEEIARLFAWTENSRGLSLIDWPGVGVPRVPLFTDRELVLPAAPPKPIAGARLLGRPNTAGRRSDRRPPAVVEAPSASASAAPVDLPPALFDALVAGWTQILRAAIQDQSDRGPAIDCTPRLPGRAYGDLLR